MAISPEIGGYDVSYFRADCETPASATAAGEVTTFVPSVGRLISIEATVHSASIAGAECSVNPVQNGAEMVSHVSMPNRQRVPLLGVDSQ